MEMVLLSFGFMLDYGFIYGLWFVDFNLMEWLWFVNAIQRHKCEKKYAKKIISNLKGH